MSSLDDLCSQPLPPEALHGIQLFNAGPYFEAHEALETAWRAEPGPLRDLYRGILQVGVGYYHLLHGNYRGACKMFRRARPWLSPFPAHCCGIDLEQFRRDADAVERTVLRLGPGHIQNFDKTLLKPVSYQSIQVDK
jgi:predicted metal-dependent hydrolase